MSNKCRICGNKIPGHREGYEQICDKCIDSLSSCPHCFCMTYTIDGKCGKCKKEKI